MHWQSRSAMRERDHTIALMPMGHDADEGTPMLGLVIGLVLSLPFWVAIWGAFQ